MLFAPRSPDRTGPEQIALGDPPLLVTIRRSARARRLTLRLAAGTGAATVTAPPRVGLREIRRFLTAHEGWLAERRARLPGPVVPCPGASLTLRGRTVALTRTDGRRVHHAGDELAVPGRDDAAFRGKLLGWLRETARTEAAAACDRHAAALGRGYARLTIRDPRSRWGSCTSAGNIMLSWRLILAPEEVLDYVAAHEVAHLAEMNHGPAFWRTVGRLMPDYQPHRAWLRANGAGLHRLQF